MMDAGVFIHAVISDLYANTDDELQAGRVKAYHYYLGNASADKMRGTTFMKLSCIPSCHNLIESHSI